MTFIMVEEMKPQKSKAGRDYFSFWVRILLNDLVISIGGWKFYPDIRKISTPSQGKGKEKGFVNTCKMNGAFYNAVLKKACEVMDVIEDNVKGEKSDD